MKISWRIITSTLFFLALVLVSKSSVLAQSASPTPSPSPSSSPAPKTDELDGLKKAIDELTAKITEVQKEKKSLSSTITFLNTKISLNEKEIEKTLFEIRMLEAQVNDLGQRIEGLELSLHDLSSALIERVQNQYKRGRGDGLERMFATTGISSLFKETKYLSQVRAHTQELLLNTEQKRQVYDQEKKTKEQAQREMLALKAKLEVQQKDLQQQKQDKNRLLAITQNDEKTYQDQLAKTLEEYNAIQSIAAGAGNETEVRDVKTGDTIASIIAGASVCSTGTHLHLEVRKDGALRNPSSYLKGADIVWRDSSFDFSGSWEWPLNDPAIVTQGYGYTSWSRTGFYGGQPHTGIDMVSKSSSLTVKALKDGKLYRGSVKCGRGNLRYVRVKHDDGVSSYYLHVNY
jgi:peptidoglycan hydrolase CwlO-like protein